MTNCQLFCHRMVFYHCIQAEWRKTYHQKNRLRIQSHRRRYAFDICCKCAAHISQYFLEFFLARFMRFTRPSHFRTFGRLATVQLFKLHMNVVQLTVFTWKNTNNSDHPVNTTLLFPERIENPVISLFCNLVNPTIP